MRPEDLAYVAAMLDQHGRFQTRRLMHGTDLPEVVLQGKIWALRWLADATGVNMVEIPKSYNRHQCSEHCPEKHTQIESLTHRVVLSGARATIVLHNVEPFMRVRGAEARDLVRIGQQIGCKSNVLADMARLGWPIPEMSHA